MRTAVAIVVMVMVAVSALAEPQVKAYVQRQTVALRSPFLFFIEASGSDVGEPQIPEVPGLNINKQASSASSGTQISIQGNKTVAFNTRRLGYYAQATTPGPIIIPKIAVPIDGQTVYTAPITINVIDRSGGGQQAIPEPQMGTQVSNNPASGSHGARRDPTWEEAVFVDSDVSRRTVYQGEAILLSLRVWRLNVAGLAVGGYRGQQLKFPSTDGFYATSLDSVEETKERNGFSYVVTVYRQLLYPTNEGSLTIGSWHWEGVGQYGGFWNAQQKEFSFDTPPISITVKPLPDRPADFSGAVGTFKIRAALTNTQLMQGVPAQFVVTVSGTGNPDALNTITLPKIENVQISDPEKNAKQVENNGIISFEKTFTFAITPLQAGTLVIPEIALCYFEPGAEQYKTEKTQPISVPVVLSSEQNATRVVVAPNELPTTNMLNIIGEDIVPIVTNAGRLGPSQVGGAATTALVGIPALAYGGLALFMRRRRRFEQDTGFARGYLAKSKGRKRLSAVVGAAEPSDELYRAVAGYIADKFNVPEGGVTSGDVKRLFEEYNLDGELVEGFSQILKACERARYAGVRLSPDEVAALTDAAVVAMDRLDVQMKRRPAR